MNCKNDWGYLKRNHFFCKRFLTLITPRAIIPITPAIKNPKIIANITIPTALSNAVNKLTNVFIMSILSVPILF